MTDLSAVVRELKKERDKLNRAIAALSGRRGKRKLSAAARERIAAAQRTRWAKWAKSKGKKGTRKKS